MERNPWNWKEIIQSKRSAANRLRAKRRQAVCENFIGWEHQEEPIPSSLPWNPGTLPIPVHANLVYPKNVASIRNRYYPCHSFIDEEIKVHKQKWCAPGFTASGRGEEYGNWMVQLPGSTFCSLNHHALMWLPQGGSDITGVKYLFLLTVGDYGTDSDLEFCR